MSEAGRTVIQITLRRAVLALAAAGLLVAGASSSARASSATGTAAAVVGPAVRTLPAPPFPAPAAACPTGRSAGLALVSLRRNDITDTDAWLAANELDLGDVDPGALPAWVPSSLPGAVRATRPLRAQLSGGRLLVVYGADYASGSAIAAYDTSSYRRLFAYDLTAWGYSPQTRRADRWLTFQEVRWAALQGSVLYVESAHSTYAATSGGRTAYITALDTAHGGRVLWRSAAQVANAGTFVVDAARGVIVAGYGFTREPDRLTVLSLHDGRLLGDLPLPTAPELIAVKGGRLYVRTYDRDAVVSPGPATSASPTAPRCDATGS